MATTDSDKLKLENQRGPDNPNDKLLTEAGTILKYYENQCNERWRLKPSHNHL